MHGMLLHLIGRAQIEALKLNKQQENRTLDYKRDLKLDRDDDKREFARDVSSFANASGGDIVFGVEEAKDADNGKLGYPGEIVGLENASFDELKLRMTQIIQSTIDPRVPGIDFHKVDGFPRGPVIILRVPQSWCGPHMVKIQNQTHFYSRNSAGKQPLDVREIRSLFLANADIEQRVRRFRDERLGRILAGETPVELTTGPKLVLHVVPLSHAGASPPDIETLAKNAGHLPPLAHGNGWDDRFNLDGFVTYSGPQSGAQRSYSQVFRQGACEGVTTMPVSTSGEFDALYVEKLIVECAAVFVRILRGTGSEVPLIALITLMGVKNTTVLRQNTLFPKEKIIERDTLLLPDITLDSTAELTTAFRPAFDALWQASGWPGSFGYDEQGKWDALKHR